MSRFPACIMTTCVVPWTEQFTLDEELFRDEVRTLLQANYRHLYVFGTAGEGYAVVVGARIDPSGQRELTYYGRHDTLYSSRVTVTAYDLATGKPLGSSRSATVDYTSLNADSKSQETVGPLAKSVVAAIRSH